MSSNAAPLRLIWIVPKFPLGMPDGARHATRQLVRHLTQMNVVIDLVCLAPEGDSPDASAAQNHLGVRSCWTLTRSASKLWPLPGLRTPFTFRSFAVNAIRVPFWRHLQSLLDLPPSRPSEKTVVVFDGLHTFAALTPVQLQELSCRCQGVIYRAHNVETVLWEQCADRARTPWMRGFFRYQASLVKRFERHIAEHVRWIAAVSEDDAERFRSWNTDTDAGSIPIGMDFPEEQMSMFPENEALKLLFIGRLDWLPNREGLRWFLDSVWSKARAQRSGLTLKIAGSGDGRWLDAYRHTPGLDILGRVPDVEPLYRACTLAIAPLFQGSGTRVKILEAARYQRPVLTTALGAEGTGLVPGVSFLRAETEAAWVSCLATVTTERCREIGVIAERTIRQRFDGKSIAERFKEKVSHG